MAEQRVTQKIEVPRGTGLQGFLRAVEEILKLPKVESLQVDSRGTVTYTRWASKDPEEQEPAVLGIDFESLMPYAVIRNSKRLRELLIPPSAGPLEALAALFHAANLDRLHPVAFVGGSQSSFFRWYEGVTGHRLDPEGSVYGLPFYQDRHIDDTMLFLCAAYSREGSLIDTQHSYKLLIPEV